MNGVMFLRPPSLATRVMAVVIGLVWVVVGGWWTHENEVNGIEFPTRRTTWVCPAVGASGVMLIISGLRRTKSRDFEDEVSDVGGRGRFARGDEDFGD
jgi:hypothetical protein